MKPKKEKSYIAIFFKAFVIFLLTLTIVGFLTPDNPLRHRSDPRLRCYSNIRVLQGAVEMYNMDSDVFMKDLDFNSLIEGKYLKEKPIPPDKYCNYTNKGDLSEEGQVYCVLHGGLTFDVDNTEEKRKKERDDTVKNIKEGIMVLSLYAIPSVIYLFFALM